MGRRKFPNPIILKPAGDHAATTGASGGKGDGEDALAGIKHEQQDEVREKGIIVGVKALLDGHRLGNRLGLSPEPEV